MPEYKFTYLEKHIDIIEKPNDEAAHAWAHMWAQGQDVKILSIVRVGKNEDEKCPLCEERKAKQDQIVELSPLIEEQRK
jgi:hypothetical protein